MYKEVEIYNMWFEKEEDHTQANILNAIKMGIDSSASNNGNTLVGCSLSVSTKELFPVNKRLDLSVIDYHFSFRRLGDMEIPIAYVPLYDYLRCVEMLQAAEYQISVLQEAVSKKSQENQ